MRAVCRMLLESLLLFSFVVGCAPKELSPEEVEAAAVGTWRDEKDFPLELRADKTMTTPIDLQDRNGTWSMNAETREIVIEIAEGRPQGDRVYPATTWTAYLSKDGTALKLYNLPPSSIEYAKEQLGKDPSAVLRKD